MKKKLAMLMGLLLVAAAAMVPISSAFAQGEGADGAILANVTPISEVALTVTAPVAGATPSTAVTVPDTAEYTAEVDEWLDKAGNPFTGTFEAGKTYKVSLMVRADEEQSFTESCAVKVNGSAATITIWESEGMFACEASFTAAAASTVISKVNLLLGEPTGQEKLAEAKVDTAKTEGISGVTTSWADKYGNARPADFRASSGRTYIATIAVTCEDGYVFDADATFDVGIIKFNSSTASSSQTCKATVSDDGKTATASLSLEAVAKPSSGGCTIVSLFGDDAPETGKLRDFRDGALMQSAAGEALVGLYYDVSPTAVAFLDEHPLARSAAHWLIGAFADTLPAHEGGSL